MPAGLRRLVLSLVALAAGAQAVVGFLTRDTGAISSLTGKLPWAHGVVLLGILFLYIGPARSYWSTVQEAKHRRAEVAALKRENAKLRARRTALGNTAALEREARRLGMVRPGERPYVVKHLPKVAPSFGCGAAP